MMGGHHFGQPYTLSPLSLHTDRCQLIEPHMVCYNLFFLIVLLTISTLGLSHLMYRYAFLERLHELWTYRPIFFILSIITSSPRSITFHHFHLVILFFAFVIACFILFILYFLLLGLVILHILMHKNSHITYITPSMTLTQRFQFERLPHGWDFMCSSVI